MKINNITDVFFDLDHTLWDFDKNSALTFDKIFDINDIDIDLDEFIEVYEPINLKYWRLYRNDEIDKKNLRFNRLNDAFNELGVSLEANLINTLSNSYIEHLSSFNYLFDGTQKILEYLKPKYNLHIITNGFQEVQDDKLKNSGIYNYFKTVTNSEMVGVKKPNPKIFDFALNLANAKPESSIMIGDSLEADVLGALDCGLEAIMFNYRNIALDTGIKHVNNLLALKSYL